MDHLRWLLGVLLVTFFLFCLVCNLLIVLRFCFFHKRSSMVLVAGGLAGMFGFLALPFPVLNDWFWLPLVADLAVLIFLTGKKFYDATSGSSRAK